MPAFRASDTVEAAAQTVFDQDYPNLVLGISVPSDDAETIAAIRRLEHPCIVLVEQEGKGISDGRNTVLRVVEADLYMFLDADDYMKPGVISTYVRHRLNSGVPGLRYGHYVRGILGQEVKCRPAPFLGRVWAPFTRLSLMNFVATGAVMIDREIVERIGSFDTRFNHAEDWHYWLRVVREYPLYGIDFTAYHYTYAKLRLASPYPRSFFDQGLQVIKDIKPPLLLHLLADICTRAQYVVYYVRTFRQRRTLAEYADIKLGDVLLLVPGLGLMALRRFRLI